MISLMKIDDVNGRELPLEEYLTELGEIIASWSTKPISVNDQGEVIDGVETFNALMAFGVLYVPVKQGCGQGIPSRVSLDLLDPFHEIVGDNKRIYDSVVELVARDLPTPMVKLRSLSNREVTTWAKLEWYHPFSLSIKDRIAWFILHNAIRKGVLKNKLIYEATSTNTGLGIVGLANYYGFKTRIYLPSTAQRCVDYIFAAMGSETIRKNVPITTAMIDEVLRDAERDNAFVPNQFENDYNFIAHLRYTAKEVDYQLSSKGVKPSAIISGVGTSGHLSAVAFYFKNKYRNVKVYGVQPSKDSHIPGLRRIETGMKWIHMIELDGLIDVSLDEAFQGILRVARADGLLVGMSAGATIYAAEKLIERGKVKGDLVVIIPDHGVKYIELMESLVAKYCLETSNSHE
ncbi:MAG: pyridoxal-phosphate dependent enzyme [Desulfurococcaceae archaeon]